MSASSVAVEVPATSANLGSGFDSLGVALDWTLRLRFTLHDDPQPAPSDPIALMAGRAVLTLYNMAAIPPPAGLEVSVEPEGPPVGRGLGLSAAARVGGVIAANALTGSDYDPETLLPLAVQLERHADNAVPAMFGGLQVVVEHDLDGVLHLGLDTPEELRLVLLVPDLTMATEETRQKLPQRVSRNHAVHNIGRAALLIAALQERRYDLLQAATEDVLHQPARSTLLPAMPAIFRAARAAGAHGAYLSGGGSAVAAFVSDGAEAVAGAMREAAAAVGLEAEARICRMSSRGAELIDDTAAPGVGSAGR